MKLLLNVHFFRGSSDGNIIFLYAWKKFLDRHAGDLKCKVLLVNNGFRPDLFRSVAGTHPTFRIASSALAWDTESSYQPINAQCGNYDYIARLDHDAFPSVECINSICDFLSANQDIDFLSASNFPRTISFSDDRAKNLLGNACHPKERKWWPWGYPTYNGDLFVIRSQFFRECLRQYNEAGWIAARSGSKCPFHTYSMRYGEICDTLSKPLADKSLANVEVRVDGGICTDFWTIMCARKMKMAGIVGIGGRSFASVNSLHRANEILNLGTLDGVTDTDDTAFGHERSVVAPYFHLGDGYITEHYFNALGSGDAFMGRVEIFKAGPRSYQTIHYSIIRDIVMSTGNTDLINKFNNSMEAVFKYCNVDRPGLDRFTDSVQHIYGSFLRKLGYL